MGEIENPGTRASVSEASKCVATNDVSKHTTHTSDPQDSRHVAPEPLAEINRRIIDRIAVQCLISAPHAKAVAALAMIGGVE